MKRILCILLTLPLLLGAEPTSAAEAVPMQEPINGFTLGQDPEWSTAHLQAHEDREDHRRYHQEMEGDQREWLRNHAEDQGTEKYADLYRSLREHLNANHREAHRMSQNWHFQYGQRIFAIEQKMTEVTPPETPFVRTGRPQVVRKSRREIEKDFFERLAANLETASRSTRS